MRHIFDGFTRSEFSDEIFSIFGRALIVATRFDSSCKALAILLLSKGLVVVRHTLSDDEYAKMIEKIKKNYENLSRAIQSLNFNGEIQEILTNARVARNELVHEATLGFDEGFDNLEDVELSNHLNYIKKLVHQVIKGVILISIIIEVHNKEPVSDFLFSELYENKYLNWVMERF